MQARFSGLIVSISVLLVIDSTRLARSHSTALEWLTWHAASLFTHHYVEHGLNLAKRVSVFGGVSANLTSPLLREGQGTMERGPSERRVPEASALQSLRARLC